MPEGITVIDHGRLVLVEGTPAPMRKLGKLWLSAVMPERIEVILTTLARMQAERLVYDFDANAPNTGIPHQFRHRGAAPIGYRDLETRRTSLEDIVLGLVESSA